MIGERREARTKKNEYKKKKKKKKGGERAPAAPSLCLLKCS